MRIITIQKPDSRGTTLTAYLADETMEENPPRPCVLICPGGGYSFVSNREGEPVALRFASKGFHAFVLNYSVYEGAYFPTALCEAMWAMGQIRSHRDEWRLDPNKVAVCGFSAGGHLAASLGVFWNRPELLQKAGVTAQEAMPQALVLCYPVISSGEYAHEGSFRALLGERYEDVEARAFLSLDKQVTKDTPPCFLWHTADDSCVPVQNTLRFATALSEHKIPYELRVFESGPHGLSLGVQETSLQEHPTRVWSGLAIDWLKQKLESTK